MVATRRWVLLFALPVIAAVLLGIVGPMSGRQGDEDGPPVEDTANAAAVAPLTTTAIRLPIDSRLNQFPYGVYGLDERDRDPVYTYRYTNGYREPSGDIDPVNLLGAIKSDGVYNVVLSSRLGSISIEDKIIRTLEAAKSRNTKLIVRLLAWNSDSTVNTTETNRRMWRFRGVFTKRPDLRPVIYAWYSYDEPMQKMAQSLRLSEVRKAYTLHKNHFSDILVFTVYNQNLNCTDGSDADRFGECLLGESRNPYGTGVGDIIGLNIYPVVCRDGVPTYGTNAIRNLYTHGRRLIGSKRIFAVAQAHAFVATQSACRQRASFLSRQTTGYALARPRA